MTLAAPTTTVRPTETAAPAYDLGALRRLFPHTERTVYLNHAGSSPLALPVKRALAEAVEHTGGGDDGLWDMGWVDELDARLHAGIAGLINASPGEIAIVPNTGTALNYVALSLPARPGQNIIVCDKEFPSNVYPWMNLARRAGLELRIVPMDGGGLTVRRLAERADADTLLVAVSAVEFLTGFRTDVAALGAFCRERGIFFAVDGIQSLGHIPLDVRAAQVDFLGTGALKSLMGPAGIGFLYIRRDLLDRLDMPIAGATSVTDYLNWCNYHLDFRPEAARYELSTVNWIGMAGFDASLKMLMDLGIANIDAWTTRLADGLMADLAERGFEILTPRDPAGHGPIVSFAVSDPKAALAELAAHNVAAAVREGYVRVSIHCYNTVDEVLRVAQILDEYGGGQMK
ncbi:MAG: aminotransferase class V-fold PLP-dependent enzyme [Chloroflexi bacterium]|nr:aminotransferase class V-fold PLP-dependent enzyme [Chloroflexota bacterium]